MPQTQNQPKSQTPTPVEMSPDEFEAHVASRLGVPEGLYKSLTRQESGGKQYRADGSVVASPANNTPGAKGQSARGRYQVLPSTAQKYGMNPDDEYDNIYAGLRYLREKYDEVRPHVKTDNDAWMGALAGYHGGERQTRHIAKTGEIAPGRDMNMTTADYVDSIMKGWSQRANRDTNQAAPPASPVAAPARQSKAPARVAQPAPSNSPFDFRSAPSLGIEALGETAPKYIQTINAAQKDQSPQRQAERQLARKQGEFNRKPLLSQAVELASQGYDQGANALADTVMGVYDAGREIASGNFSNVGKTLEAGGRRLVGLASRMPAPGIILPATEESIRQDSKAKELIRQRDLIRRSQNPYWAGSEQSRANLAERMAVTESDDALTNTARDAVRAVPAAGLSSLPAIAGGMVGGPAGMAAAMLPQQDLADPVTSAANIGGALVGAKASGGVATLLGNAAKPVRMAGALGASSAINVGQSAATQIAQTGEVDTRKLTEDAIVGAAFGINDAVRAGGAVDAQRSVEAGIRAEKSRTAMPGAVEPRQTAVIPITRQPGDANAATVPAAQPASAGAIRPATRGEKPGPQERIVTASVDGKRQSFIYSAKHYATPNAARQAIRASATKPAGEASAPQVIVYGRDEAPGTRPAEGFERDVATVGGQDYLFDYPAGMDRKVAGAQVASEVAKAEELRTQQQAETERRAKLADQAERAKRPLYGFDALGEANRPRPILPQRRSRASQPAEYAPIDLEAQGREISSAPSQPLAPVEVAPTVKQKVASLPDAAERRREQMRNEATDVALDAAERRKQLVDRGTKEDYQRALQELAAEDEALKIKYQNSSSATERAELVKARTGLRQTRLEYMKAARTAPAQVQAPQSVAEWRAQRERDAAQPQQPQAEAPRVALAKPAPTAELSNVVEIKPDVAPKSSNAKASADLSAIEYLKRATEGEGIRVDERYARRMLGAKENGIVALTNKNARNTLDNAREMLHEGGFTLPDGRSFADATEGDVFDFLLTHGKQPRNASTKSFNRAISDGESDFYEARARSMELRQAQETNPTSDIAVADESPATQGQTVEEHLAAPELPRRAGTTPFDGIKMIESPGGRGLRLRLPYRHTGFLNAAKSLMGRFYEDSDKRGGEWFVDPKNAQRIKELAAFHYKQPVAVQGDTVNFEPVPREAFLGQEESQYSQMVRDNADAVERLYQLPNINNTEGRGLQTALKDYISANGFENRHLRALLAAVKSFQSEQAKQADEIDFYRQRKNPTPEPPTPPANAGAAVAESAPLDAARVNDAAQRLADAFNRSKKLEPGEVAAKAQATAELLLRSIDNADAPALVKLLDTGNQTSRKIFTEETGVDLGRNNDSMRTALKEWRLSKQGNSEPLYREDTADLVPPSRMLSETKTPVSPTQEFARMPMPDLYQEVDRLTEQRNDDIRRGHLSLDEQADLNTRLYAAKDQYKQRRSNASKEVTEARNVLKDDDEARAVMAEKALNPKSRKQDRRVMSPDERRKAELNLKRAEKELATMPTLIEAAPPLTPEQISKRQARRIARYRQLDEMRAREARGEDHLDTGQLAQMDSVMAKTSQLPKIGETGYTGDLQDVDNVASAPVREAIKGESRFLNESVNRAAKSNPNRQVVAGGTSRVSAGVPRASSSLAEPGNAPSRNRNNRTSQTADQGRTGRQPAGQQSETIPNQEQALTLEQQANQAIASARARQQAATDDMRGLRPTEEDWMTSDEKRVVHEYRLKAGQSANQEQVDARQRVAEKRAQRLKDTQVQQAQAKDTLTAQSALSDSIPAAETRPRAVSDSPKRDEAIAAGSASLRQGQHQDFGIVTETPNQKGVPVNKVRVVDQQGIEHIVQRPTRGLGNEKMTWLKTGRLTVKKAPVVKDSLTTQSASNLPANKQVEAPQPLAAENKAESGLPANKELQVGQAVKFTFEGYSGKGSVKKILPDGRIVIEEAGGVGETTVPARAIRQSAPLRTGRNKEAGFINLGAKGKRPSVPKDFDPDTYADSIYGRRAVSEMDGNALGALQDALDQVADAHARNDFAAFKDAKKKAEALSRDDIATIIGTTRKAGLLTSARTHIRNVGGTGIFQGVEEIARIPGSLMDLAVSTVTKQRGLTGASLSQVSRAGYKAATEGTRAAWDVLKNGAVEDQQAQQQLFEMASGSKVLDAYVNYNFRLLSAEDRIFRTYATDRALRGRVEAQALTEARQGAIKRSEIAQRQRDLMSNPSEDLLAGAILDAEVATFNNDNAISSAVRAGRETLRQNGGAGKAANLAIDIVMPFDRTPTNIIARALEYSPLGLGKNAAQIAKAITSKSFTAEQQKDFSQTFGRSVTGSGLILLGYALASQGKATGFRDDDEPRDWKRMAQERERGRSAMSVYNEATNTWHQIGGFSPMGNLIAIGATMFEHGEDGQAAFYATAKTVADQPLLESANTLTKMSKNAPRAGGQLAASFVPTFVKDIGALKDGTARQAKGFTQQIQRAVPIWRESLPAQPQYETRWTDIADPTLTRTNKGAIRPTRLVKR